MAEKPTDTPSPLAAAAEALLESCGIRGGTPCRTEDGCVEVDERQLTALRAALAADAAWRARAEAAVAFAEAAWGEHVADSMRHKERIVAGPDGGVCIPAGWVAEGKVMLAARAEAEAKLDAAREAWFAARRRYEEAARG